MQSLSLPPAPSAGQLLVAGDWYVAVQTAIAHATPH